MNILVERRAAASGELEPAIVWFGNRGVAVRSVVDRWYGTNHCWWKVDTEDGLYVLRRDDSTGEWDLAAVTHP